MTASSRPGVADVRLAIDMWMVRVSISQRTAPTSGSVERYTAVDFDDDTPGVHPWMKETGRLLPTAPGHWRTDRTSVEARNDAAALAAAAAMYDAARGFLLLGIAPTAGPAAIASPDRFFLEIGDASWSFAASAVPVAAQRVLDAARSLVQASAAA